MRRPRINPAFSHGKQLGFLGCPTGVPEPKDNQDRRPNGSGALHNPGEILVSRAVADLVAGSSIEFEDRGEHDLKGMSGASKLFAVKS